LTLDQAKELIMFCKEQGVARVKMGTFEAELRAPQVQLNEVDLTNISKNLMDSMPPDSAMLFAAVEDPVKEPNDTPIPQLRENTDMI
jgi:hypothetical protein